MWPTKEVMKRRGLELGIRGELQPRMLGRAAPLAALLLLPGLLVCGVGSNSGSRISAVALCFGRERTETAKRAGAPSPGSGDLGLRL